MKIAFLASQSVHVIKWTNEMARRGHEVHLITMHRGGEVPVADVKIHKLPVAAPLGYFLNFLPLKSILKKIQPDILNVHYASGYGTLARLSSFHPVVLSVWGTDVYDFPYESKWKMKTIIRNLKYADQIASTSYCMRDQVRNLVIPNKKIKITPFGVDCIKFKPDGMKSKTKFRVGTVKTMEKRYGIDRLIEAFALACQNGLSDAELILVGGGEKIQSLKGLVKKLNIINQVKFIGPVPHNEVPQWLNSFDVYVALSRSESFGVAIVEASACGVPVIVSNVGGLPEVVSDGKTGYIVAEGDIEAVAERILLLQSEKAHREYLGKQGRQFVLDNYEWYENADRMEKVYLDTIENFHLNDTKMKIN